LPSTGFTDATHVISEYYWNNGSILNIPVTSLQSPKSSWRSRGLDESHVLSLVQSYKSNSAAINEMPPGGCVVFDRSLYRANFKRPLEQDKILTFLENNPAYVYSGEHRREALSRLHHVIF
jgi:hypothetical protein